MPLVRVLLLSLALAGALATPAGADFTSLPSGFSEQAVTGDNFFPVGFAPAPDGRVFVVQKFGQVKVWEDGELEEVIDLSAEVNDYSDRGLLGVAVDKDFAANGYLYVLYTREVPGLPVANHDEDRPTASRLERLTVNAANDVTARLPILGTFGGAPCPAPSNTVDCIPSDHGWHSIGTVRVDPVDGTLWVGSGDGHGHHIDGDSHRPTNEASLAGKILHIDRNGRGLVGHPFCPSETDLTKVCTKLYAKGFRNPFRFTVRPGGRGVVAGDVGFSQQEEVNLVKPGRDYGWPCYEGTAQTELHRTSSTCAAYYAAGTATPPAWSYPHGDGASVLGGPELSGSNYPAAWQGDVFVADYVQGWIKRLELDADDEVVAVRDFASGGSGVVDLQQLPGGDLAYLDLGYAPPPAVAGDPQVRRFQYTPQNNAPTARVTATPTSGAAPLAVQFDATSSTDPDGDALSYAWAFGDGTTGTGATPTKTYTSNGDYTARVTVSDGRGQTDDATVLVRVGSDGPPTATITSPADESTYRNGVPVALQGTGADPEGPVTLRWVVTLNHAGHTHPAGTGTGASFTFTPETDHDADSFYVVQLTATDSGGRTHTHQIELRPETRLITLDSSPAGAPLSWDGQTAAAPQSRTAAIGFRPTIEAPETFTRDGRTYQFKGWSDGGARAHRAEVPAADSMLVARYERVGVRTLRVVPTQDTYVQEGVGIADGQGQALLVDAAPKQRSLLRFAVSGIGGDVVVGARLRLHARDGGAGGEVRPLTAGSTWTEATTWPGPSFSGTVLGAFGSVVYNRGYEAGLLASAFRDGQHDLAIVSGIDDGVGWSSRESAHPPELVLEVAAPPSTTIEEGPSGTVADATPTFRFGGGATYECRLDGGEWRTCGTTWTSPALDDGDHVLDARAISAAGAIDPTPATRAFRVDTEAPATSITGGPVGETSEPNAVFTFTASGEPAGFECRMDGGAWAACTSPWAPGRLAPGAHVAQVRARDAVGNVEAEPAERRFTVLAPPAQPAPAQTAPPARTTPPPAAGAQTPPRDTRRPVVTVPASARRPIRVRRSGARWSAPYRLLFDEPVTGTLELRTAGGALLGRLAFRARADATVVASPVLNRTARRLLRRALRARAVLVVRDAAGNATRTTWSTTLRPPLR